MDGTRRSARRAAMVAAMVVGAVLALASCAPVADEADATSTPTPTVTDEPTSTPTDDVDNGGGNGSDGPQDPAQQTRRSGPAAEYGGPPYGDQGAEFLGDGRWCSTVALFWGDDAPPPQNVTFTIDGVVSDPAGALTAQPQVCGNANATTSCIGFTMTPETTSVFCSMLLIAGPSFPGSASVTFVGTLVCTEARFCDAAIARPAAPGPRIVVTDPGSPPEEAESPETDAPESDPPADESPGTPSSESESP